MRAENASNTRSGEGQALRIAADECDERVLLRGHPPTAHGCVQNEHLVLLAPLREGERRPRRARAVVDEHAAVPHRGQGELHHQAAMSSVGTHTASRSTDSARAATDSWRSNEPVAWLYEGDVRRVQVWTLKPAAAIAEAMGPP